MKNSYDTKAARTHRFYNRLSELGFTWEESNALRRIEMTLHRWSEQECGDSNDRVSWMIERDEKTGVPYMVRQYHGGGVGLSDRMSRTRIPDRENGALKRLKAIVDARNARYGNTLANTLKIENEGKTYAQAAAICAGNEIIPYHQSDPRGCALHLVKRADLATKENQIIRKAKEYGAKIEFRDIENRAPSGCWIVAGMKGTPLFSATFNTEELAAKAYLKHRKSSIPERFTLPIDSVYTRGFAVCI